MDLMRISEQLEEGELSPEPQPNKDSSKVAQLCVKQERDEELMHNESVLENIKDTNVVPDGQPSSPGNRSPSNEIVVKTENEKEVIPDSFFDDLIDSFDLDKPKKKHKKDKTNRKEKRKRERSEEEHAHKHKQRKYKTEKCDNSQIQISPAEGSHFNGLSETQRDRVRRPEEGDELPLVSSYNKQRTCLKENHYADNSTNNIPKISVKNFGCNSFLPFNSIKLEKNSNSTPVLEDCASSVLSVELKRERATQRALIAFKFLREAKIEKNSSALLTNFIYTETMRKLPQGCSQAKPQIYEHRSPLHNVSNVRYKFNSNALRFNLHEWGLEAMPPAAVEIAQALNFSAQNLHKKMLVTKLPIKLKVKSEPDTEKYVMHSQLFANSSTQTDSSRVRSYDAETQTTESLMSSKTIAKEQLPLMHLLGKLNKYQLLALNDFAELICEPADSAFDCYRLRQRMLDIYTCSQMSNKYKLNSEDKGD